MKRNMLALLIVMMSALAGCIAPAILTPVPTPTAAATLMHTPSASPSHTPIFPESSNIYPSIGDRLLFTENMNCQLPCWYGLRPGSSQAHEIASAIRESLELPEDYVFNESKRDNNTVAVEGIWSPPTDPSTPRNLRPGLIVEGYYDPQTNIFSGLFMRWDNFTKYPITPQRILSEFGVPGEVLLGFITIFQGYTGPQALFIYPERGLTIELGFTLPVRTNPAGLSIAKWCLSGGGDYKEFSVEVRVRSITGVEGLGKTLVDAPEWYTLEELSGTTPTALYQLSLQREEACLSLEL